jgi:DNA phosphorothioation-dependent restriction protein DptG
VRGEMTEDSDVIHWNIVSRLGDHIESADLNYSDKDIVNAIDGLIDTIKIQMSKEDPRAYLSFLSEIMRGSDDFERGVQRDIDTDIDDIDFDEDEGF